MILEELTLRNWRGYRDTHKFRFEEGFNLVVGRNEAGKSTLFEAMARVLFDRYTSRAEEIRLIQPLGSSLSPEAELVFNINGDRYRVRKRFLDQPVSELYKDRGGTWELDHEGDRADQELRNILQGEAAGRATRPEHRGLAQALWYLQHEPPLPKDAWVESIKRGLAGLVQHVTESTDESRIFGAIEIVYAEDFTPTGRVASKSEITGLEEDILKEEQELEELKSHAAHVEDLRFDLEELTERRSESTLRLEQAKCDLEDLTKALDAADALEEQKRQKEGAIKSVKETLQKLSEDQSNIARRMKEIDECAIALEEASLKSERLEADARQEQLAAERHRKRWKEEYEPKLQTIEVNLRVLLALERLRRLTRERDQLQDYLSRVKDVEEDLHLANQNLAKFHAPSESELEVFQNNLSDLRVVEAQVEASAIRVNFQLNDAEAKVNAQPKAQRSTDSDEFLITAPTSFTLQGVGVVRVRGGGSSIEDLNERSMEFHSKINSVLQNYGAEGPQAVSDLCQQRIDLEDKVERLQERLHELADEVDEQPEEELARVEIGIREESKVASAASEEWKTWGGQKIREQASALENEKDRLIALIGEEQSYESNANKTHLEYIGKAQEASNNMSGLRSKIKSSEKENNELLKTYGTIEHLNGLVEQSETQLQVAKADLDSVVQDYEIRVERPKRLHQQGVESLKRLQEQRGLISNDIVDRKARIEEAAAQGLYSQTADLEGALQAKRRRLEVVQRRADGAKLLRDVVVAYRKQQSAALTEPVATLVNNWLPLLTDDAYDALELSEELLPIGVHSSRYDASLPLESLSYGTYEQVIVLVRLALGVLLSKDERNLVVIDDRLVNADSIRMKRLCLILEEVASKTCQVVVATCDDTRYSGIAGHIIRVPFDGKVS